MTQEVERLTVLTHELQDRLTLEEMLQQIADTAAALLATPRVSVRLLDPTRTRLLVTCRAGSPIHHDAQVAFRLGEGLIGWIAEQRRPLRLGDAQTDPRFVVRPDLKEPMGSFLGVPLVAGRACIGVLSALNPAHDYFTPHHEALLGLLAGICAPHVEVARLSRLSQSDPLTGALNRRGLDLAFPEVAATDADDGVVRPLSVAMVDIDHFKRVNDEYGHAIGDEVLKRVVHLLSSVLRAGDAIVRMGGEEFLLILPSVELARAAPIAERARAAVAEARFTAADVTLEVTISVGVAERRAGEGRDALIKRADEALYAAKRDGRDRVSSAH
jgi:diguanylate cyclase (GGDEF)-like protein